MAADVRTHLPLVLAVCESSGTAAAWPGVPTDAFLIRATGGRGSAAGTGRPVEVKLLIILALYPSH